MKKVCFVCLGNICRSPMAEGLFQKMVEENGLSHLIHVESRATSSWEIGNPPHPGTLDILHREGVSTHHMVASKITKHDFDSFDYIIGMDHDNIHDLKKMTTYHHKIHLLRDIDPSTKNEIVPDPYYTGAYDYTYQLIMESLPKWLERIKKEMDN